VYVFVSVCKLIVGVGVLCVSLYVTVCVLSVCVTKRFPYQREKNEHDGM
jgi:hypothetical protein